LRDLQSQGIAQTEDEVREALAKRDERDSTRNHSPLQPASDAIILDTTDLTLEGQVEKIVSLAREREKRQKLKKNP
jgi:cytidylate kinase